MLRRFVVTLALACLVAPAQASDQALLDRALDSARAQFARALPQLGATAHGVDVAAYRKALLLQTFTGGAWDGPVTPSLTIRTEATGSCAKFAAFVRMPPEDGVVPLVLCPQFFAPGADALRALTILHEMVHVVAGRDECQAMAFAAHVEVLASGRFTPVDAYWAASRCQQSPFSLP
ncbi:hypothetical protein [Devosia aquimaris]|uniref:hypothetical protein n=1 Tax=Devosia aquimaris TaxID=2866214 RepID=UPI001CD0DEB7|nr:hypothetical protein [Devosia sp. CJK-A8-3]